MNPIVEAWRAKQDQLKQQGQTEGQVAGVTLVMINSVCQQVKDDILDAKRTSADVKDTLLSVQNVLKNVDDVFQQNVQKSSKNAQQEIKEVGNDVKKSVNEACNVLGDFLPQIGQVSEQFKQNLAPIEGQVLDLRQALDKIDFNKISELTAAIVRSNEQQKSVENAVLKGQKTASNWTKLLFTLLSVLGASVVGFAVVFVLFSAVDTKLFKENSELKKANSDLYKKYIDYKDERDEAVAKYNELAEVAKWLAGGEDKLRAYIQQYRESKRK